MAAKLQCEICGGKLVGKPGGIFECDSCGMEYSTEWAKAKIQEITGTVKVEGTVEVTGKVQIDGPVKVEGGGPNADSLIKYGNLELEDEKWESAAGFFKEALLSNPEKAEAYLGLLLAEHRLRNPEEIETIEDYKYRADEKVRIRITEQGANQIVLIKTVRAATGLGLTEAKALIENIPVSIDVNGEMLAELRKNGTVFEVEKGLLISGFTAESIETSEYYSKFVRFADCAERERISNYIAASRKLVEERARAKRQEEEKRAENERRAAAEKAEVERKKKIETLNKEKDRLQAELSTVKGVFAGSRKAMIEKHIAEIDAQLKKLG